MRTVFADENKHSLNEFFTGYTPARPGTKQAYVKGWTQVENQQTLSEIINWSSNFGGVINQETTYIVDVDDTEAAELILNIIKKENVQCRVHKTTKGLHIFFKKGGRLEVKSNGKKQGRITNLTPVCGLAPGKVDYFPGGFIMLRTDGVDRLVVHETDEIGECPAWLQAWSNKRETCEKLYTDFLNFKEGDGRNDAFFRLGGKCKGRGLTYEEFLDTARIINTYIVADPLDEAELSTATRLEAWEDFEVKQGRGRPKGSSKKDKPKNIVSTTNGKIPFPVDEESERPAYDVVATGLINKFHIKRLDGQIRVYNQGVYTKPRASNSGHVLEHDLETRFVGINRNTVKEVLASIDRQCFEGGTESPARYINFKNGIFDLETGEFMEHTPDVVTVNQIPHNFNPDADLTAYDSFLEGIACGDKEIQTVLEEIVGACMYRGTVQQLAFVLTGSGQNGKSTYNKMLRFVVGDDSSCTLDPKDFSCDSSRFKLSSLYGKSANVCDDISHLNIADPANFKRVITGDRLSAEYKNENPFEFNPYATHVFSVNEMPRMSDIGGATTRRLLMIPFNAVFQKDDSFEDKIKSSEGIAEAAILKGILGLQRVMREKTFTIPEASKKMMEEYKIENDSVRAYLEDRKEELREIYQGDYHIWNQPTSEIFSDYKRWCWETERKPVSNIAMSKRVKQIVPNVTIERKRLRGRNNEELNARVYVKLTW